MQLTDVLLIAFGLSGVYAVVGHFVLYHRVKRRGVPLQWRLSNVPFYAAARYFAHRPPVRSKGLDVLAVTVSLSYVLTFVFAALAFPEMLGRDPGG